MSRTAYQFSPRHERTGLLRDASTASIANSLGFGHFSPSPGIAALYTGRELDPETGLYYYRNRYYGAELGRFVSRDPIGYEGGDLNLVRYVLTAPTDLRDPHGVWPFHDAYIPDEAGGGTLGYGRPATARPKCGKEIGHYLDALTHMLPRHFAQLCDVERRRRICASLTTAQGWDITQLAMAGLERGFDAFAPEPTVFGGSGPCAGTVTVHGKCYYAAEVNYFLYGLIMHLCNADARVERRTGFLANTRWEGIAFTVGYRGLSPTYVPRYLEFLPGSARPARRFRGPGVLNRVRWLSAGWHGEAASVTARVVSECCPNDDAYDGDLEVWIGNKHHGPLSSSRLNMTHANIQRLRVPAK